MKRKRWIAAGIISTCLFGVSGTYAYYQDTVSVRNHISTGDINIGIQEYEVKDGKESLMRTLTEGWFFRLRRYRKYRGSQIMHSPVMSV